MSPKARLTIAVGIQLFILGAICIWTHAGVLSGYILVFGIMFVVLPQILVANVVFIPIEKFLDVRGKGSLKKIGVPLAGMVCHLVLFLSFIDYGGSQRHFSLDPPMLKMAIAMAVIGLEWGVIWRMTTLVPLDAGGSYHD